MVQLRRINLSRARSLAKGSQLNIDWNAINDALLEMSLYRPPSTGLSSLIEQGLLERGWNPSLPAVSPITTDSNLTKGQKQVKTLVERLQKSGQEVPKPEDAGHHGIVGWLLNALGAPGGAVTTLIDDLINRDGQVHPIQSLVQGFTGKNRKTGSDILKDLGVKNKVVQGVGGFGLDLLLDPTTYLGIGAVRHVGTEAVRNVAREALQNAGKKFTENELDDIIRKAADPTKRFEYKTPDERIAIVARALGRPAEKIVPSSNTLNTINRADNAVTTPKMQLDLSTLQKESPQLPTYRLLEAQPNLPKQYNLNVGIPFTNISKSIADITPLINRARKTVSQLPESSNSILRSVGRLGQRISRASSHLFRQYPLPSSVANLFKQRDYRINAEYREALQRAEKIDKDLGGGYTQVPELHKAVAYLLDDPKTGEKMLEGLSSEARKKVFDVYHEASVIFDRIAREEKELGILDSNKVRQFYFAHLIKGDPDAVRAAQQQLVARKASRLQMSSRFQQERSLDTLKELQEFVDDFNARYQGEGKIEINLDIGQVVATRKLTSEVLKENHKLVDRLKHLGDEYVRPVGKETAFDPNFEQVPDIKGLEGYAVQKDVAEFLKEWNEVTNPGGVNGIVRVIGAFNRLWKASVTTTPTHYVNNIIGAVWNNWLMGVRNPLDYQKAFQLMTIGKGRSFEPNMNALRNVTIQLPSGEVMDGRIIIALARQFNVIRAGSEVDFLDRSLQRVGQASKLRKYASAPQDLDEYLDDTARLAGFINQLEKTGDPYSAALEVKKYLFDYNELSKTEKKLFSNIVPFYAWLRKNIPLQLISLIRKPGMYTGAAHLQEEMANATGLNIEDLPGYVANALTIPLFRRDNGNVVFTSPYALPANDMFEFLGALENPEEFGKYIMNQLAPWYRMVPEMAANEDFFTGAPIDKAAADTGTTPSAQAVLSHMFQQTGLPYRIAQLFQSDTDENGKPKQHVTKSNLIGLVDYNPEYFQRNVLPYQYGGQLRRYIQDLTKEGQTVYSKTELDQAEKTGLTPEQVRIIRSLLDQAGQRKTQKNILAMYRQLQQQGQLP